ncbi:hypothetical protein P7C70_g1351, partial [Phenoliferia sp. Uapishka_3]
MGNSADTYRPIQELEAKRLMYDLMTDPKKWEKHIERFAASTTVAIAYGRRVDSSSVGFIKSIHDRMEAVSLLNLPGKQVLDRYPFLQSLPEIMTPYKARWRALREESNIFWMGLIHQCADRIQLGTAAPSFAKDLLERREGLEITDGEFGLLVGGIVGAGIETTSGTLFAFALAMVSFPEAHRTAQAELDKVVGMSRSPTWNDEVNLPYCRALVKEVLRWRPVAVLGGTPHASTADDIYDGYFIPAGTTILGKSIEIQSSSPTLMSSDPNAFWMDTARRTRNASDTLGLAGDLSCAVGLTTVHDKHPRKPRDGNRNATWVLRSRLRVEAQSNETRSILNMPVRESFDLSSSFVADTPQILSEQAFGTFVFPGRSVEVDEKATADSDLSDDDEVRLGFDFGSLFDSSFHPSPSTPTLFTSLVTTHLITSTSNAANAAGGSAPAAGAPPQAYGAPPQAYGAPPQQQQQSYGAPPPAQPGQANPYGQQSQYASPPGAPPIPGSRPGQPGQPQQGAYGAPQGQPPASLTPGGGAGQAPPQSPGFGAPPQSQGQYSSQPQVYGQPAQYGHFDQTFQGQGQYGAPPQSQQSQYGAPPQQYGQPPQSQYGQQPPQGQYGAPPQGQQYGAPPQQQQGGPPAAGGAASDPRVILTLLQQCVQDQHLNAFYPQGSLEALAQNVARSGAVQKLASEWRMPLEIAMDLAKLSLFDTILYCDDSGSMTFEEGGTRIDDLKLIVSRVAMAASLFDQDGIQVRFMNSKIEGNNINSEQAALALVSQVKFSGLTPLGTSLNNKILEPLILGPARQGRLQKPVLVICVTDGVPGGEDRYTIVKAITNAARTLQQTRYGSDAVSFQLAQVGNDQKARAFLEELDVHPEIGELIDTTSNYENEADDMLKANPPVELTPELCYQQRAPLCINPRPSSQALRHPSCCPGPRLTSLLPPSLQSFSEQEKELFTKYGKVPQKKGLLTTKVQERRYFDSGDYAMKQAGVSGATGAHSIGSKIPSPADIPHPSPMSTSPTFGTISTSPTLAGTSPARDDWTSGTGGGSEPGSYGSGGSLSGTGSGPQSGSAGYSGGSGYDTGSSGGSSGNGAMGDGQGYGGSSQGSSGGGSSGYGSSSEGKGGDSGSSSGGMASLPADLTSSVADTTSVMTEATTSSQIRDISVTSELTQAATSTMAANSATGEATSTSPAAIAQATQYGSGASNWGTDYSSCVQMCQATYGQSTMGAGTPPEAGSGALGNNSSSSTSSPPSGVGNVAANSTTPLVAGPGQVVVAPIKGDLRFVPFAINVAAGQTVEYVWGAGPHTVTQSSSLTICNKTLEAGGFASGLQNATFKFPVAVNQSTSPTFFYCSVPTHCEKGMFGIMNPAQASQADASFNAYMSKLTTSDFAFSQMMNETDAMCVGNKAAASWGGMFDTAQLPEWALAPAAYNVLATRQHFATNPSLLTDSASTSTNSSTVSSDSAGTSAGAASSTSIAQNSEQAAGAENLHGSSRALLVAGALAVIGLF